MLSGVGQIRNVGRIMAQEKALKTTVLKGFPKAMGMLEKAQKHLGTEIATTSINAIGTAAVAPVFIAFNPLSKTDKETRQYSALRQPVSAVLAIGTQFAAMVPFNKYLNKLINEGKLGKLYDKSQLQDASYIAAKIKKANPKLNKEQISAMTQGTIVKQFQRAMKKLAKTGGAENLYEAVKKQVHTLNKNVTSLKVMTNVAIGLAMIPVSCTLLNVIYPKFIEMFFPHLCKDKPCDKSEVNNGK